MYPSKVVENQPFDEAVDVGETSDVASEYTPTPRGPPGINPLSSVGGAGPNRRGVLVNPVGGPVSPSAAPSTTPSGRSPRQVRLRSKTAAQQSDPFISFHSPLPVFHSLFLTYIDGLC